jgi:predicted phage terminase large subunit-like protein
MAVKATDLTHREYLALLRQDFCAFIERSFHQINPQTKFLRNWHIEVMAAKLEACRRGETRRLIINLPPRFLKSHGASIALPAWILGHNPAAAIICVSYAQEFAEKFGRECRSVINSDWYRRIFPTRLSPQKQSAQEFVTKENGYRIATSVGGVLTGRGADFIIIDDPIKPSEALSDSTRKSTNQWFDSTLFSRLNSKQTGCIILVMQRLHQDDLVGHVLESEGWEILSFPAIADRDEDYVFDTIYGRRHYVRPAGHVLHPERESPETLKRIRQTVGEYNFLTQYQQAPVPLEGGLVKAAWFKFYAQNDLPQRFDQVIQSWDTANKLTELSDFSVCTTWGINAKQIYLLYVFRKRLNYPDLKRAVVEQAEMHRATVVLIEDKASGTQLVQELVNDGLRIVKPIKPEGDKKMRMNAQTATIENGFVYLPQEASWFADYLLEITTFPGSKYDDQADSTSQALAWINQLEPEPEIMKVYRRENAWTMHTQGHSLEAIAESQQVSPETAKIWIEEYNQLELKREAGRFGGEPRCAECGGLLLFNTEWTQSDGKKYHPACWRKMTYGC